MQISFTKEELKYIETDVSGSYGLKCRDDAPEKIKESIKRKLEAHKRWLSSGGTK